MLAAREPARRFASASTIKTFLLAGALETERPERIVIDPSLRAEGDGVLRHFPLPVELEWEAVLTDHGGHRFAFRGVNVVRVRDGRFEWVRAYFDPTMGDETAG